MFCVGRCATPICREMEKKKKKLRSFALLENYQRMKCQGVLMGSPHITFHRVVLHAFFEVLDWIYDLFLSSVGGSSGIP